MAPTKAVDSSGSLSTKIVERLRDLIRLVSNPRYSMFGLIWTTGVSIPLQYVIKDDIWMRRSIEPEPFSIASAQQPPVAEIITPARMKGCGRVVDFYRCTAQAIAQCLIKHF